MTRQLHQSYWVSQSYNRRVPKVHILRGYFSFFRLNDWLRSVLLFGLCLRYQYWYTFFRVTQEVCGFFFVNILGVCPNRDIDFCINLGLGTKPISMCPYSMALTELKKLKDQLHELSSKGFIRSSVLHWYAPVLFVKNKNGYIQMYINYLQFIKVTINNIYSFSYIEDLFDCL